MYAVQVLSCAFVVCTTVTFGSYILLRHCLMQWSDEC
ncbi:hypothetical protein ACVW16_005350 [Bradyrhizobium sp. USDA 4474]